MQDVGERLVVALGEPAARELLEVLKRPEADRAALIGRLHPGNDARWLAELTRAAGAPKASPQDHRESSEEPSEREVGEPTR